MMSINYSDHLYFHVLSKLGPREFCLQCIKPWLSRCELVIFVHFELCRRTARETLSHQTLDLAVSAPKHLLLKIHMRVIWNKNDEVLE
jgi:hypothetical protein